MKVCPNFLPTGGGWLIRQTTRADSRLWCKRFPIRTGGHRCPPTAVSSRDGAQTAKSSRRISRRPFLDQSTGGRIHRHTDHADPELEAHTIIPPGEEKRPQKGTKPWTPVLCLTPSLAILQCENDVAFTIRLGLQHRRGSVSTDGGGGSVPPKNQCRDAMP